MTKKLEIYGRPLERGVTGEAEFFVPLSSLQDHPFFRFEPDLYIIMNQGNTSRNEPLIVKRSIFEENRFIILSGHVRKRIALALREEEISIIIIDEKVRPLMSADEIEIMKKENKNQWTKKQKLDFIFNHFGEKLSKENRLGTNKEGEETKEVGVLIERSSLGRIPRGTASRLIAERRNELLKKKETVIDSMELRTVADVFGKKIADFEKNVKIAKAIIGENNYQEYPHFRFNKTVKFTDILGLTSGQKNLSENLLLAKELKLDPQIIIDIENKIASLDEKSRSSRIMKQKLLILVRDLLKISVHKKEKEEIDEQIKELKKKSEAKLKMILHHGEEIGESLGRGTIEQLEILKDTEKENYETISSIFKVFPSVFEKVENFIPTWEKFLNHLGFSSKTQINSALDRLEILKQRNKKSSSSTK